MAIAFSAISGVTELPAPANPAATKGNVAFTRMAKIVVPASSTVAALPLGISLAPGTIVLGAIIDTDTSFGATATLALSTSTSTFVAARKVSVTGGEACTIATNLAVVVPTSATADSEVSLTLAAASSPASEVVVYITLVCASIKPVESLYTTVTV